ncbi:hypothetical protein B5E41_29190 [Rhizobium esperanzae]|uniref:Uncharacterized protein n=1 Tax=Rhizobium esperanzae TaxID=1967781 RepID=A0A246DL99_9HYPH|nr:hypothetical protein [Rhizobium esperanzae]OWO90004.1 hypothetical protein B5E41_29190 [Rhizobium esperanzae]
MNKPVKIPVTPAAVIVIIDGIIMTAGYGILGMSIMGAAFALLTFNNVRRRTVGPIGLVVLLMLTGGFLAPLTAMLAEKPTGEELASHRKYAAVICPSYYRMNLVQEFNSGQSWCREFPQFDAASAEAAKIDREATGSTAPVSSTSLWK